MAKIRHMLKPALDTPWTFSSNSSSCRFEISEEMFKRSSRQRLGDKFWAGIGESALTISPESLISKAFQDKLDEYKIKARVVSKEFRSYYELRAIFHDVPDYETELKTCEAFTKVEHQFPEQSLEFIILTEDELANLH